MPGFTNDVHIFMPHPCFHKESLKYIYVPVSVLSKVYDMVPVHVVLRIPNFSQIMTHAWMLGLS